MNYRYTSALMLPLAALLTAGCVNIGNHKPPKNLLTLTATAAAPANDKPSSQSKPLLLVAPPAVPAELKVTRIPVTTSPTTIAYLTDAVWVDSPSHLFGNVLSETIASHNRFMVVSYRSAVGVSYRLTGNLSAFGLDAVHQQVVITYDAFFRGSNDKKMETVTSHHFEIRQPVTKQDAVSVANILNKAANQLSGEVASWLDQQQVTMPAS
ncbi:MAG: ABC-type transport auxiliary lipoprotein family protein [Zymomonas mobilis]|uniref:Cholesterol transport system auxiliary component n=1 Tax=Zymomonas mobilis TaxID=542 RepID=A0A542W1E7_ZYMMB|nr:ABC-type transport auxiliary lipoprotein family protein [Zymomonas mobilis]TQL17415.1 cholesterol transport system auxiliary component [Zymomonas mobilis]